MSVKRIILVVLTLVIGGLFTYASVAYAVKTKDSLDFQKVELKSRSSEIQELDVKYDKLKTDLNKASEDKNQNQEEIKRLQDEKTNLEKQKQDLEAQLQARIEQKSKLALASQKLANTVTGTATASAASNGGDMRAVVASAAQKYGLGTSYFLQVANCESTLNPNAVNYSYYAGGGYPSGLFQFIPSTWRHYSSLAGWDGASVFNAQANAETAAYAFSTGHSGEWACA